jgi:hypothetical protein
VRRSSVSRSSLERLLERPLPERLELERLEPERSSSDLLGLRRESSSRSDRIDRWSSSHSLPVERLVPRGALLEDREEGEEEGDAVRRRLTG